MLAQRVVRRHRLAERFLTDVLQLSWAEAHHEAGKWEHVMSKNVEEAINNLLGEPTTCPHGNPIPGSSYVATDASPLSQQTIGERFTVRRIPEELEFTPGSARVPRGVVVAPGLLGRHHRRLAGRHAHDRDRRSPRGGWHVRERADPGHDVTVLATACRGSPRPSRAAVLTLGACGTTYIDTSKTVPPTGDVATTTLPPVAADTPLPTLLGDIERLMRHLDEQIVDGDHVPETMARIDQLWVVAEQPDPRPRPRRPVPVPAGDRPRPQRRRPRRPADASKGYKVLIAAIAAYPAG